MLYKILVFSLLFVSIKSFSTPWPYGEDYLLNQLKISYEALNARTGFCADLRYRKIDSIKSDWLYSLPKLKQKAILMIITDKAHERCMKEEFAKFNSALVKYTSASKTRVHFELMLEVIGSGYNSKDNKVIATISDLSYDKVIELSKRPEFYTPFNSIAAARVIEPE